MAGLKFLGKLFSFLLTIVGVLPFFLGTSTYKEFLEFANLSQRAAYIIGAVLVIIAGAIFLVLNRLRDKDAEKSSDYIKEFHQEVTKNCFALRNRNRSTPEFPDHEKFYQDTKAKGYILCDHIANFLKYKYNKDFGVCIKMIERRSTVRGKANWIDTVQVYTYCRAGYEHIAREKEEKERAMKKDSTARYLTPIRENSGFLGILRANESRDGQQQGASAFMVPNIWTYKLLRRIMQESPYSTPNDSSPKYYNSTLVVPIRIETECLQPKDQEPFAGEFQVIGFLCVDHKKSLPIATLREMVGYINGFGSSLYEWFHEIRKVDDKITEYERKNRAKEK